MDVFFECPHVCPKLNEHSDEYNEPSASETNHRTYVCIDVLFWLLDQCIVKLCFRFPGTESHDMDSDVSKLKVRKTFCRSFFDSLQ